VKGFPRVALQTNNAGKERVELSYLDLTLELRADKLRGCGESNDDGTAGRVGDWTTAPRVRTAR
jgi:hypothetical protein